MVNNRLTMDVRDTDLTLGSDSLDGEDPLVGNGNPPQYSCLLNSMGRGAWPATVHGVAKSQTRLNDQVQSPGWATHKLENNHTVEVLCQE